MVEKDWKVADEGAARLCEGREIAPHGKCSMVGDFFLHGALSNCDGTAGEVPTTIKLSIAALNAALSIAENKRKARRHEQKKAAQFL